MPLRQAECVGELLFICFNIWGVVTEHITLIIIICGILLLFKLGWIILRCHIAVLCLEPLHRRQMKHNEKIDFCPGCQGNCHKLVNWMVLSVFIFILSKYSKYYKCSKDGKYNVYCVMFILNLSIIFNQIV